MCTVTWVAEEVLVSKENSSMELVFLPTRNNEFLTGLILTLSVLSNRKKLKSCQTCDFFVNVAYFLNNVQYFDSKVQNIEPVSSFRDKNRLRPLEKIRKVSRRDY
jgi:hypothetical protein